MSHNEHMEGGFGYVEDADHDVFPVAEVVPTFKNAAAERKWLLEQMAGAFRVFARKGYVLGTAGHISVRDPENPEHFWLNPLGQHFGTLKASDMVLVDKHGNIVGGSKRPVNKAGFMIHSSIHEARPDVNVACHTHSVFGKAYSTFGKPLEMINQDACVFFNNCAVYSSFGGVVLSGDEGKHIASALGDKNAVILQNHGLLTAGQNVGEAAALFIVMEEACHAQLLADSSKDEKVYIPDDKAKYTFEAMADPEVMYAEFLPDIEYEAYLDPSFKN